MLATWANLYFTLAATTYIFYISRDEGGKWGIESEWEEKIF